MLKKIVLDLETQPSFAKATEDCLMNRISEYLFGGQLC